MLQLFQRVVTEANAATTPLAALQGALDAVCEHAAWPVGHAYVADPQDPGRLQPADAWHDDDPARHEEFRLLTMRTPLAEGEGLPGRVLRSGKPEWVVGRHEDPGLPRAKVAAACGLNSGLAFPVTSAGRLAAVLEFYAPDATRPDEDFLEAMSQLGLHLGHVLELLGARLAVREKEATAAMMASELRHLTALVSHDLQEPLRLVTSYVELLEKKYGGNLDATAREYVAYAAAGALRMKGLLNDFLTYAQLWEAAGSHGAVSCGAAARAALSRLDRRVRESRAQVTIRPLPEVFGNAAEVEQLFVHLLDNALKYHGGKPPAVEVSAERSGALWLFRVRDRGIGIDPRFQEKLFTLFRRLHAHADFKGTGLGLASSRRIVERHGGRIWVESKPGEGSTFLFTLPAAPGEGEPAAGKAPAGP